MDALKEQGSTYLESMIEACHELTERYRDGVKMNCPLCLVANTCMIDYEDVVGICRDCPWTWFTGKLCTETAIVESKRLRQLPRWIAYMEAELDERA